MGGGDPQGGQLARAANGGHPVPPSGDQAPRNGAFPPFIPDDYAIEIVDNCILDRYNPYTGETQECAEVDTNITQTCYDLYDFNRGGTVVFSIATLVVAFV